MIIFFKGFIELYMPELPKIFKDKKFEYFNPVRFFDANPTAEVYFYATKPTEFSFEHLLATINSSALVPGLELFVDFLKSDHSLTYGKFVSDALSSDEIKELSLSKNAVYEEEIHYCQQVNDAFAAYFSSKEADLGEPPEKPFNTSDYDAVVNYKSEQERYERQKEELLALKKRQENPYQYHVFMEDGSDFFVCMAGNNTKDYCLNNEISILGMDEPFQRMKNFGPQVYKGKTMKRCRQIQLVPDSLGRPKVAIVKSLFGDLGEEKSSGATDPFLQDVFFKRRGDKNIKGIIETIQKNQDDIVFCDASNNVLVQGVAGSGKTLVLFRRLERLTSGLDRIEPSSIVLIEPNDIYSSYFQDYLVEAGLGAIKRNDISSYLLDLWSRYRRYIVGKESSKRYTTNDEAKFYSDRKKQIRIDDDSDIDLINFCYKEQLKSYIRVFLANQKNQNVTFDTLVGSFIAEISKKIKAPVIRQASPTPDTISKSLCTSMLYAIVALLYRKYGPLPEEQNEKVIAIDEAQDYYNGILALVAEVEPFAVMNVFLDVRQDIGVSGRSKYRSGEDFKASLERPGKVGRKYEYFELNENYRNSNEIIDYCNSKFGTSDRGFGVNTIAPQVISPSRLVSMLTLHTLLGNRNAVIYEPRRFADEIETYLKPLFEYYKFNVGFYTPAESKGLEFDNVFLLGDTSMSNNARYVSCTRAISELYFVRGQSGEDM